MKDSWRAGVSESEKTELVTDGIYQISRNPAFLGFDVLYIGRLYMKQEKNSRIMNIERVDSIEL